MGELEGTWKTIDGEMFFIVVIDGWLHRRVLLRDGRWSAIDNTLHSTKELKMRGGTLKNQVERTIDSYMSKERSRNEQVNRAVNNMKEVYETDW